MKQQLHHLRGPLIAIVVLAMSTGLAYAARPTGDRGAPSTVSNANSSETADPTESEAPEGTESPDASETPDASGSPDSNTNCTTDPTTLTADQLAAMSHGSIVCWAAQQATPEGYDNHGAWVRHWAQMNNGSGNSSSGKSGGAPTGKGKGLSHRPS